MQTGWRRILDSRGSWFWGNYNPPPHVCDGDVRGNYLAVLDGGVQVIRGPGWVVNEVFCCLPPQEPECVIKNTARKNGAYALFHCS